LFLKKIYVKINVILAYKIYKMNKVSSHNYTWAITKEQIKQSIDNLPKWLSEWVEMIQKLKEYIVWNIFSVLELDWTKVQEAEEEYIKALKSLQDIDESKEDYALKMKEQIDWMSKNQTLNYYLWWWLRKRIKKWNRNAKFDKFRWKSKREINNMEGENGIWKEEYYKFLKVVDFRQMKKSYLNSFTKFSNFPWKYSWKTLSTYKDDLHMSVEEKQDLDIYTSSILNKNNKRNTRSKTISFDKDIFNNSYEDDEKNIKCFFEEDFDWNIRYFSYNDLINDIEVFWVETWIHKIDENDIPEDIRKKYFPSLNRRIKTTMYNNLLWELRDQQEMLMYGFKNYDLESSDDISYQNWLIAEKVVEWYFKKLANFSNYNIKIQKASVWEDRRKKIDLFVILEDKKSWVNIEKQLQITLQKNVSVKERQIMKRKKALQNSGSEFTDIELVQLTFWDLSEKLRIWQFFNRPVWWIDDLLDSWERELMGTTFNRIVSELNEKKKKL